MLKINIPNDANLIIKTLESCGYEAYVVGGCVRDSILGKEPKDWDICTSATPDQVLEVFRCFRVIETGLKHGTVTIVIAGEPYEVTTFRIDGEYSDNRRPDSVSFTRSLKEDLARRDFTINAMAYSDRAGIVDPFGGLEDIKHRIIRCVGDPEARFQEDALRILRAIRFDSQLGFRVHPETAAAMHKLKDNLHDISAERISSEFNKILTGVCPSITLDVFRVIIAVVIPETVSMFDLDQKNPYHIHKLWDHTLIATGAVRNDLVLRLATFFHDIGKPSCMTIDDAGVGHFYGHPDKGAVMTRKILRRLRYDNQTISTVVSLIEHHDLPLQLTQKAARRYLSRLGEENAFLLMEVKLADNMAQNPALCEDRITEIHAVEDLMTGIIKDQLCFSLKDLAVNGRDLIGIGIREGKEIGDLLKKLLELVLEECVENERSALLEMVAEISG